MKLIIFVSGIFALVALAIGAPVEVREDSSSSVPSIVPINESGQEVEPESETSPSESETQNPDTDNQEVEGGQEQPEYTPSQYGRLARFNGNFFQLYGFTEQFGANSEAFAGNFLNYKGNLLEFLGQEHSLRQLAGYFKASQDEYYNKGQAASGREAEIYQAQGDLGGELAKLVDETADIEHSQAKLEYDQMKETVEQLQLEIQQGRMEAKQALAELDQGELEEKQIKTENQFHGVISKYIELQQELEALKQNEQQKPAGPIETSSE